MTTVLVPEFVPSRHGLPFPNSLPPGVPVLELPTPFGRIPIGQAAGGVCGGMAFAVLDYFTYDLPVPTNLEPPLIRYLCRRLLDSWNFPFGVLKYYDWQRRPSASRFAGGVRVLSGLSALTLESEWPKIQQCLDAGQLAPLGLVKAHSFRPTHLGFNHQVLAYGYTLDPAGQSLRLHVYDPNYPGDDETTLTIPTTNPDGPNAVVHSREGDSVRGVFLTEYRAPTAPPNVA